MLTLYIHILGLATSQVVRPDIVYADDVHDTDDDEADDKEYARRQGTVKYVEYYPAGIGPDYRYREKEEFWGIWSLNTNEWCRIRNPYSAFYYDDNALRGGNFDWARNRWIETVVKRKPGMKHHVPHGAREVGAGENGDSSIANIFFAHQNTNCYMRALAYTLAAIDLAFAYFLLRSNFVSQYDESRVFMREHGYEFSDRSARFCDPAEKSHKRKPSLLPFLLDPQRSAGLGILLVIPTSIVGEDEMHALAVDLDRRLIYDPCIEMAYTLTKENMDICCGKMVNPEDGCLGIAFIFQVKLVSPKIRSRFVF